MKGKNSKYESGCPSSTNSKCIKWDGPAIPCLDICHDEVLTDVVYAIADKVCTLVGDVDMTTLDLHCLIDLCSNCPTEKTLHNVLQLILDNQCTLKELIDDIITALNSAAGGGAVVLTLDMKCLTVLDSFGNPVPQNINQTLQSIINELCLHKTKIATLETTVVNLQTQINNISVGGSGTTYVPPTVNVPVDCITSSSATLPADLAVQPTLNALCELKGVLGSNAELSTSIGRQCTNLNTVYGLTANWILAPGTVADTMNNMWIALCDALSRIKTIETTCCAPNCADIKIGFSSIYSDVDKTWDITFDSANGTSIPVGFTDCGSVMTLTDKLNHSKVIPITIVQGDTVTVSSAGLDLSDIITVSIKTCFEHVTGLKCNDCFGGVITGNVDINCPFCELTAGGTTGNVTITYNSPTNLTQILTLVLTPGQTSFIQSDAIIISVVATGNSFIVDQDCIDLTEAPTTCYEFAWDVNYYCGSSPGALQLMTGVQIGTVFVPFTVNNTTTGGNSQNNVFDMNPASDNPPYTNIPANAVTVLLGSHLDSVLDGINNTHSALVTATCGTSNIAFNNNSGCNEGASVNTLKVQVPASLSAVPELVIEVTPLYAGSTHTKRYIKGILTTNCNC